MKIYYDTTKYVKGKRVYRVRDLVPGALYIAENIWSENTYVISITKLIAWGVGYIEAEYNIADAHQYRLNDFDWILSEYMLQPEGRKDNPSFVVYEAVTPTFTCKGCGSHDVPMPIQAVQMLNGQRVGRSCNYYRCAHCKTINRHVYVTGYPTRYETQKGAQAKS